jgi:hypothetical protein
MLFENCSEHLPYKQGVTGSNPVVPTTIREGVRQCLAPFVFYAGETGVKQSSFFTILSGVTISQNFR